MVGRRLVLVVAVAALVLGCKARSKPSAAAPSGPARAAAVAGSFYPAEPKELRSTVDAYLAQARTVLPAGEQVVLILVPHAGYVYSGLCAAHAFAALDALRFDTVILLGSPHSSPVRGAAVYAGSGFQTPLGTVPVDRELARAMAGSSSVVREDEAPHEGEHSLEVELPFLLRIREDVRIVPVLASGDQATLESVAASIIQAVKKRPGGFDRVLIVVSTDLAHYPSAVDARKTDAEILAAFCSLDPPTLAAADRSIMARKVPGLLCSMCGLDAAYVGLLVARAAGATEARLLDARTSAEAEVPGADSGRTVGYGAVAVTRPASTAAGPTIREPLSAKERMFLLTIARDSIRKYLRNGKVASFSAPEGCPHLLEVRGCFVSLYTRTAKGKELRGCIGRHEPSLPLVEVVPQMALASAFKDPRFRPVSAKELQGLEIEVSVYRTGIVPISSPDEFVVGEHGIILTVGDAQATFLPQVAAEQGWDRTATCENLSLKAGLDRNAWKRKDARFSVYATEVFREQD